MADPLRRVVTGVDAEGRSTAVEDGPAPRFYELDRLGGMSATAIWEAGTPLPDTGAGGEPADPLPVQPPPGAVRVFRFVLPPDGAVDADMDAVVGEIAERLPSLLETIDPEREFGMHRTDTLDVLYILSGGVDLVLEDGRTALRAGDSVVQRGTWHAWSNPHDEPCVMLVTMLRPAAAG